MTLEIIRPSEIQSELQRLWDSFEKTNKNRASLFNLIFFTTKRARAEYVKLIAEKVVEKFPSRILFIIADPDAKTPYLNTRVNVVPINSDIACDFIQIEVSGSYEERIPFLIYPNLLPDLPIYVIWAEDPCRSSTLLEQLMPLASRLIFDSDSTKNLPAFAKKLLQLQNAGHTVADLNWGRIESWRDLLTSTFYTPDRLKELRNSSQISLFYNDIPSDFYTHTQTQALYLQTWLSTQMGWKKGSVKFTLYPEKQVNQKPGTILSLDIETKDQHHYSFGRDLQLPHHVLMRFSTLEKCDIPLRYIFAKDESGSSLVKEICQRGTSQHFLNLLESLSNVK